MQVVPYGALIATPWGSLGSTAAASFAKSQQRGEADGILWRISLADVQSEGTFLHFARLYHILTVIADEGMVLETAEGVLIAIPLPPIYFAGDLAVMGRLPHVPIRDLNVIFHPDHICADVSVHTGPADIVPTGTMDVVFVVSGVARIGELAFGPARCCY